MNSPPLPKSIEWVGGLDGYVRIIDQTRLPGALTMLECRDADGVWEAIRQLRIRGAPAIGIAAAMGVVLGVRSYERSDEAGFLRHLDKVCDYLATARPTAVNLSWALDRMRRFARSIGSSEATRVPPAHEAKPRPSGNRDAPAPLRSRLGPSRDSSPSLKQGLLEEAKRIRDEDAQMCRAIGRNGRSLIHSGFGVLTHCNAGALATAELGTALAPIYLAHEAGCSFRVYVDETRPLLQGSRLTAWELGRAGIPVTVLCDGMAGDLMNTGRVHLVITGADRIASNGDVANKTGTYGLAVLARAHSIPFYVAAPSSTFDLSIPDGSAIPIEKRDPDEIRFGFGRLTAPPDVACYCPAFDVTPAGLICGLITERGVVQPVNRDRITATLADKNGSGASCQDKKVVQE